MNNQRKILIADDEPTYLDFFDLMLSKLGFTVEKARDGQEALEKVKKFMPDLILLDNIMPRMSGFELTKMLKKDPVFEEIPIIMFSALDDVQDKLAGFELGVDDYITKPFNFSEVLARIRAVLRSRELYAQIVLRESRLSLAEELSVDMKRELQGFVKTIDELEELQGVSEKSRKIREHAALLDARIEKTINEWEDLKKNEIGLTLLETDIHKSMNQE